MSDYDYTLWNNGLPLVDFPGGDGTFTEWNDGLPLTNQVVGTAATDLVVADADHLHDADAADLTQAYTLIVAEADHDLVDDGPLALQFGLTLAVNDGAHLVVDEGPLTLVQEHTLAVDPADHLHDADNIDVGTLYALTVAECYHVHAPPNLTLTQLHVLAVDDGAHLHTAPNINLILSDVLLAGLDSYHALVDDGPDLTTNDETIELFDYGAAGFQAGYYNGANWRSIADTSAAFQQHRYIRFLFSAASNLPTTLNKVAFATRDSGDVYAETATVLKFGGSETVVLAAGETAWSDWTDFTAPAGGEVLVSMLFNAQTYHAEYATTGKDSYRKNTTDDYTETLDFPTWGTYYNKTYTLRGAEVTENPIEIATGTHLHTAENIVLTQGNNLAVDDADHLHDADSADAFMRWDLVVADADHLHDADALTLTATHNLSVAACDHLHDAEALDLTQEHTLALTDDTLLQVADSLNLAGTNSLVVAEAYHVHAADSADLIVVLAVDETYHEHTAPNLTLVTGFDLEIPESVILTVSDNIAGMTVGMTVAEAYHTHAVDAVALGGTQSLVVAECYHRHDADGLNVYMTGDLPIQSAHHEIESDELTLGFSSTLNVREAYHRHLADTLALTQEHTLAMPDGDSYHDHVADEITIPALAEGLDRTFINSLTVQRSFWTLTRNLTINKAAQGHTISTLSG